MVNERRQSVSYSISFKQQIVQEVEQGASKESVRKKYGIRGGETINKWLRKFGKHHLINQTIRVETMEEKDRVKALEKEVLRLKMALADAFLAQRSLETVINEANKLYGTDLKKNFGESASKDSKESSK
jgi:transposase-like protein